MEIKEMTMEQVIERMAAITSEMEAEGADLEALSAEADQLIERKADLKAAQLIADTQAVIAGAGEVIETRTGDNNMSNIITRDSKEYIDAYAEYIKTGDATAVRALLTENGIDSEGKPGTVAVPTFVEQRVKAAWERNDIWNRIPKSFLKGNYKTNFEIERGPASIHLEGAPAIDEQNLVLGMVELVPVMLKKYKLLPDEIMSMRGREFLDYIYDEIEYEIIKLAVGQLISAIDDSPAVADETHPAVAATEIAEISANDFILAEAELSGDLNNAVAIMNRKTYALYRTLRTADGYQFTDLFNGMTVLFTDALPSFATASEGDTFAIVGSLEEGSHANLPNGREVQFVIDDRSIAVTSKDVVGILGKLYIGVGVVQSGAFCKLTKGAVTP